MRIYTLLLGLLLTIGVAFVAELAINSTSTRVAAEIVRDTRNSDARGPVWYGGELAPITVEAKRPATAPATAAGFEAVDGNAARAHQPRRSTALRGE